METYLPIHLCVCLSVHDVVLLTKPSVKFSLIVVYVMHRKLWSKREFYENWCKEGHASFMDINKITFIFWGESSWLFV
jgi:hypothetical protein